METRVRIARVIMARVKNACGQPQQESINLIIFFEESSAEMPWDLRVEIAFTLPELPGMPVSEVWEERRRYVQMSGTTLTLRPCHRPSIGAILLQSGNDAGCVRSIRLIAATMPTICLQPATGVSEGGHYFMPCK